MVLALKMSSKSRASSSQSYEDSLATASLGHRGGLACPHELLVSYSLAA
jgi:hypothetical protein